jgi:hypothetical protein
MILQQQGFALLTRFCGNWMGDIIVQHVLSVLTISTFSANVRDFILLDRFYILFKILLKNKTWAGVVVKALRY